MRSSTKWVITLIMVFLSLDFLILLIDMYEKWEWLEAIMTAHPLIEHAMKGPLAPLISLLLCFVVVYAEKFLKRPDIKGEYLRFECRPKLGSVKFGDAERENYSVDADMLLKVYVVNHSEHAVAIRKFKGKLYVMRKWLVKWPKIAKYLPKRTIIMEKSADLEQYSLKSEKVGQDGNVQTTYQHISDLASELHQVPLERGIPHEGWIGFTVRQIDRKDLLDLQIKVTVVDALDNIHKVNLKDKRVEQTIQHEEVLIPPLGG
jgi:hypothetical protein